MTTPALVVGDTVKLCTSPKGLAQFRSKFGELVKITPTPAGMFGDVIFTLDAETGASSHVKDIPLAYYVKASPAGTAARTPRRSALNLHEPKDDRTEAQKEDEAESFLRSFGYEVLRVGQHRKAAVCYKCLSDEQKSAKQEHRAPRYIAPTLCRIHGSVVYSMSTGSDPGIADWVLRHVERFPVWACLSVEWKRNEKSTRRAKQIELSAAGWYPIVSSLQGICAAIVEFERSVLRIEPLPEILAKGDTIK